MAPTGFHGLLGLFLASRLGENHKYLKIGLVAGSVIPDLDLLGSVLIFLLTAEKEMAIAFHRSVTHSLVIIAIILITGYLTNFYFKSASIIYYPFIVGLTAGMFIHVALDMVYFDGVTLLWPFQPLGERTIILSFTYEDLSPIYNSLLAKIIGTLDGHFELVYFLVFAHFASKHKVDQTIELKLGSKNFIIYSWPQKLKQISYFLIVEMIFFISLALLTINIPSIDRDSFIILLYIPLTPVYLLSGLLPLLMRETILNVAR